jgi:hypothetical protein
MAAIVIGCIARDMCCSPSTASTSIIADKLREGIAGLDAHFRRSVRAE